MTTEIIGIGMLEAKGRLFLEVRREPATLDWVLWIGDERLTEGASATHTTLLTEVSTALYDYLDELHLGVDELLTQLQEVDLDPSR